MAVSSAITSRSTSSTSSTSRSSWQPLVAGTAALVGLLFAVAIALLASSLAGHVAEDRSQPTATRNENGVIVDALFEGSAAK
jgi:hypothetical protein